MYTYVLKDQGKKNIMEVTLQFRVIVNEEERIQNVK